MAEYNYGAVVKAVFDYDVNKSQTIIRQQNGGFFKKYDKETGTWIPSEELAKLYDGSLEYEDITEAKAKELIARL